LSTLLHRFPCLSSIKVWVDTSKTLFIPSLPCDILLISHLSNSTCLTSIHDHIFCTFTGFFVLYPSLRICLTSSSWFVDHMFICLTFQLNAQISPFYLVVWIFTWLLLMSRV
jgi:hypothetical protein